MIARLPELFSEIERYSLQMGCGHLSDRWSRQVQLVASRVKNVVWLDDAGRELAMRAFFSGVMAGMYGENSAIAEGLRIAQRESLQIYHAETRDSRDIRHIERLLGVLHRAGTCNGREVMRNREEMISRRCGSANPLRHHIMLCKSRDEIVGSAGVV